MPSKPQVVYWDSCVFIDRLQRTPGRIELLEDLTRLAELRHLLIVTSAVTLTEVIKLDDANLNFYQDLDAIHAFFEHPWISLRAADRTIGMRASHLRRAYRLKSVDSIHLATAMVTGTPLIHTYDPHLLKLDGLTNPVGTGKIAIKEPFFPDDRPLFERGP